MPGVGCGCFLGARDLHLACCDTWLWMQLKQKSRGSRSGKSRGDDGRLKGLPKDHFEHEKVEAEGTPFPKKETVPPSQALLLEAFPDAPPAELRRFARGWPEGPAALKAYGDHLSWWAEGQPFEEAHSSVPGNWLTRGGLASDGSKVLLMQVACTDTNLAPEVYFKALCYTLEELVPREDGESQITLLLDTRGGAGWLNPKATELLPLLRICARQFPPNYPGVLRRIIVYPVPVACSLFARMALAFVDAWTRDHIVLISERVSGGWANVLRDYVSRNNIPEHALSRHSSL
ncbi:unnamed protein product [Effrenium voratum]|uniref:CRAL-TRIO domain-containing protein n=1 Tax=Effrenium voratum TaxID=2562239 RepID=A0AA36N624_9DINO|nr:unnamed protein product [Effrenium voratum]CAJ1441429.1 unnamed protein product [Effrenium voratum]